MVPLGRGRAAGGPQPWAGHEPLRMAQLLEGAMRRAEDAAGRDAVAKFARKLEASEEARQLWQRRGEELLEAATCIERKLLVMVSVPPLYLPISPYISLYRPISPYISTHLPISRR